MFVIIHTLSAYAAALLNRDESGFFKRMVMGGTPRLRISSQCLKRRLRTAGPPWDMAGAPAAVDHEDLPSSVSSRLIIERLVAVPLLAEGFPEPVVVAACQHLIAGLLKSSSKRTASADAADEAADDLEAEDTKDTKDTKGAKSAKGKGAQSALGLVTGQRITLGSHEVAYLLDMVRTACMEGAGDSKRAAAVVDTAVKKQRANLYAMRYGGGAEAALYGRFITSDVLASKDAPIHVAHMFGVDEATAEHDLITAMDDLAGDETKWANAMMASTELGSALFYGCIVVDLPQLVSNLEGVDPKAWREPDKRLAAEYVRRLVGAIVYTTPGAKVTSTAPYARPLLVAVEGSSPPRNYQNAFLRAVNPLPDLAANASEALRRFVADDNAVYGQAEFRALTGMGDLGGLQAAFGLAVGAPPSIEMVSQGIAAWIRGL